MPGSCLSCDYMTAWELLLTVAVQRQCIRVLEYILLALEKTKIKVSSVLSAECECLFYHRTVKDSCQALLSLFNLTIFTLIGYTLLHCAAAWGRLETLKALVELDVDIEALNFRGEKARDVADRYSQTECVHFLDWAGKEPKQC